MKNIVFDLEIFKKNFLLGAIVLKDDDSEEEIFQSWNIDEIKKFFNAHRQDMWIGWNNTGYDNFVLEAMLKGNDPYQMSDAIINKHFRPKLGLKFANFDLMSGCLKGFISLKLTELTSGKNIHTTDVAFDIDRELTDKEKKLTEGYNLDDLRQTAYNFHMFKDKFQLRLDIINEFKMNLIDNINVTGTQLAANVLEAKYDPTLQYKEIEVKLYDTLKLKNRQLLDFFLYKGYRNLGKGETFSVNIAGTTIDIGKGGAHSGEKYHCDKVMYADIAGYYNLTMINYDLLPRTMTKKGKELYEYMYHEQLKLKKINPIKRMVYKTILLSVFGSMNNEHTDFYDPHKFILVTTSGELFICDLIEKLDGLVKVVQTNTDGIMLEPYDWNNEEKIWDIIREWEQRTGFTVKKEYKYNLWQRDTNNYFCLDNNGKLEYKGEAVVNYDIGATSYAEGKIFKNKEPAIVARGIIDYLIYGITPEETVEKFKDDFRYFQYSCRKESFDYLTYDTQNIKTGQIKSERIDAICRVFAYNSSSELGMVYKHKDAKGKHSQSRISNLPDNIFIYNYDITTPEGISEISSRIDYEYYVNRIYERIGEFIETDEPEEEQNNLF